jgi:hypothetical protein
MRCSMPRSAAQTVPHEEVLLSMSEVKVVVKLDTNLK